MFENHRKSLIQHYIYNFSLFWSIWAVFENLKDKVKQCYQTGQKMMKNAKIKKIDSSETFWVIFKHCEFSNIGMFVLYYSVAVKDVQIQQN